MMKYIIRFDDICPTMKRTVWERIEGILRDNHIKPIIGVIPQNQDAHFSFHDYTEDDFWNKITEYIDDGWTVAMHGYNHVYQNNHSGILGISNNSEFCGVDKDEQREKILKGNEIFKSHGISTDFFFAPSHSYDENTLEVLKESGFTHISDGYWNRIVKYKGLIWIPCRDWDRIKPYKSGIHTLCVHFSHWTEENLQRFEEDIKNYRHCIIDVTEVCNNEVKQISLPELISLHCNCTLRKTKNLIKKWCKRRNSNEDSILN